MEELNRLLTQMGVPVTPEAVQRFTANPEIVLAAMVALLERPDYEIAYKMLRTSGSTLTPVSRAGLFR